MKKKHILWIVLALLLTACTTPKPESQAALNQSKGGSGRSTPPVQESPIPITARQLVEPGALMGVGPSNFAWSPVGASLANVEPKDGKDVLLIGVDPETHQALVWPAWSAPSASRIPIPNYQEKKLSNKWDGRELNDRKQK